MELFKKKINGETFIKTRSKIIVIKDGIQVINPTADILYADGWELYVPSEEKTLGKSIAEKIKEILAYDSSESINSFSVGDRDIWIDKMTRASLLLRFQAEQSNGLTETSVWHEGREYHLSLDAAMSMLYTIEIYASKCYDNTQRHIAIVKLLNSIDEVDSYDYTTGYPDKLNFNL